MWLENLAVIARSTGLSVVEVPGWQVRGHGQMSGVQSVLLHHTAGAPASRRPDSYPSLAVVRDGRAGLAGPLAHLGLGRDGTIYVIAAGLCYHAGNVSSSAFSNAYSIGIEAENSGFEPWTEIQMQAYLRLVRALMNAYSIPIDHVLGHKEAAIPRGRKTDPSFDMNNFRQQLQQGEDEMTPEQESKLNWLYENVKVNGFAFGYPEATHNALGQLIGKIDALSTAVSQLAGGAQIDMEAITKAARDGAASISAKDIADNLKISAREQA